MISDAKMPGFRVLVKSDLARLGGVSLASFMRHYFLPRGGTFPYVFWLRVEQCLRRGGLFKRFWGAVFYPIYRHYEFKYGIHANPNARIGPGLLVVHGDCVYLNCECIGKNLTVYQGVTIGDNDYKKPVVGDDVTIFSHAIVVGDIILGDNCVVGALSYVSKDVEPGQRVCGAPARVMESKR